MNGLQKEIENRHLPEIMRLENGDAVTNCVDWKLRREEIKKLFCLTGATRDLWADAHSEVLSGLAASPAFEILGQKGLICPDEILPDTLYDERNISFFLRSGTHFLGRDDWHAVMKYREEKTI